MIDIERLYAELYEIAKHAGPLDQEAVLGADWILSQPRYHERPDGRALLVADLKHIISTVTADTHPEQPPGPPSASRYFRSYARRYFSLDAAGQLLDYRRSFGKNNDQKKKKSGTIFTWMNRAVVFRVAAGLIDLWAEFDTSATKASTQAGGYRIESAYVVRHMPTSARGPVIDSVLYDIEVLQPVPHVLLLPFSRRFTTLEGVTNAEIVRPPPQLVTVVMHKRKSAAVAFGTHQTGTHLRLRVHHMASVVNARPEVSFVVDQPIGTLSLTVEQKDGRASSKKRAWEAVATTLLAEETVLDEPVENWWSCRDPTVTVLYTLRERI